MKKAKTKRLPRWPIMRKELDLLLEWAKSEDTEWPVKQFNLCALCVLLYVTGCRINEVLAMAGEQIRQLVEGHDVRVTISKTNSSRVLFLPDTYQALVREMLPALADGSGVHPTGLVSSGGNKLTYRLAEKWLNPYFARLQGSEAQQQVPLFGTHSFRIGYINRMLAHFSLPEVAQLVGHASYSTTLVYARRTSNTAYFREKLNAARLT